MKTVRFSIEMLFLCNFKSNLQVVKFKEQLKNIEIVSVHKNINVHSFVNVTDVDKTKEYIFNKTKIVEKLFLQGMIFDRIRTIK